MSHDSLRHLFPPELPDELVDSLFTFLHTLTDTFDEVYAEQIQRLLYQGKTELDEPPESYDLFEEDGPPF